ncbi:MAG: chemotaxis protein [Rhodocyclaceae bacterium]|nr:chemotaxis protein [Rhodocyclaceae bacterium]
MENQNSGRELQRMVRINEEIKSVVAVAFKINLMAMNAIFLAKRAGQTALGFGVLSNELRQFATNLQKQMDVLREMIDAIVTARSGDAFQNSSDQTTAQNRRLDQVIADTVQMVDLGGVLARSAKIEAAYGGDFSSSLMQVSTDFEQTIGKIQQSLSVLTGYR